MLKVNYIHHSGFIVETKKNILLFDYYSENNNIQINLDKYKNKKIFIFSSHSHSDHFDKKIFDFRNKTQNIKFILSDDISNKYNNSDVIFVKPHCKYKIDEISIETLKSNDMGVAFIVESDNKIIFHSGDLNWWHWNGEPDNWNKNMEISFKSEIEIIKDKKIDLAFIPVDPRLEENYILSINYIMNNLDIKKVMIMHFWNNFGIHKILYSDKRTQNYRNKIININSINEEFIIEN